MIYYAGIGARATPPEILKSMQACASSLARAGLTLRSGGAAGADEAFESGANSANGPTEIYLPWKGFRKNQSTRYGSSREARLLAKEFHPNWANVSCAGRDFHARNVYQILGNTLDTPSAFVICWTHLGETKGGTGQAIRMAEHYKIPVFNLGSLSLEQASDLITEAIENAQKTDIPF